MTGSSTTTSAWMLLLMLLALFIISSPVHMLHLHTEINREMEHLWTCSEEFTKTQHQGLNISTPQLECPFPYFIAGIKSLNCSSLYIENLVERLKINNKTCQAKNSNCSLNVNYEPFISPQAFCQKLKTLLQEINTKNCYES